MSTPLDITIAIPVRNEEKNLPLCLQAIGKDFVSQLVVIDSGSSDKTKDIATKFGAKVVDFVWDGKFPKKRNWYLRNHPPQTKWVLFLDADEYLTEDFKKELKSAVATDSKTGYWLNYTIYFLGKKMRGGYPLRKLALFQVGAGEYERIDEEQWSKLDMEVHEHPQLTGSIGVIKSKIDHQDFRDVSHYVIKHNEYAQWEAARFLKVADKGKAFDTWTRKQQLKYFLMQSILLGPAYFFGSFLFLGGFRDGVRGFAFALLKMSYFNQVYCNIRERKRMLASNLETSQPNIS